MRWGEGRRSDNVEDRRGSSVSRNVVGGGVGNGRSPCWLRCILVLTRRYWIWPRREQTDPAVTSPATRPAAGNGDGGICSHVVLADYRRYLARPAR